MPKDAMVMRTLPDLRRAVAEFRRADETIALVPTMGALHQGHLSLIRLARSLCRRVIVSVFVNPKQFGPAEDLKTYPRTFAADLAALNELKTDLVWAPASEQDIYPAGFATRIVPEGPAMVGLEDAFRPHFFSGVAVVVAKLFIQSLPDVAVFGEKDYQQLRVVTRMALDLDIPVRVVGGPTVREADGLAMSSRNVYLSPDERKLAPTLYRVLCDCAERLRRGEPLAAVMADGRAAIERATFRVDYLEARHAETLERIDSVRDRPVRLLVAARLGSTRLIDNIAVT